MPVATVVGFRSSNAALGAAYGVAVTGTMAVGMMHNPQWTAIDFSLPSASDEPFLLFHSSRSASDELMVVSLDARQVDENYIMRNPASISANEKWCLKYEVTAVNAKTVKFNVHVVC